MRNYFPSMDTIGAVASYGLPLFRHHDPFWNEPFTKLAEETERPQNLIHSIGISLLSEPYLYADKIWRKKDKVDDEDRKWAGIVANNLLLRTYEVAINTLILSAFFANFVIIPSLASCAIVVTLLSDRCNEKIREVACKIHDFIFSSTPPIWIVGALVAAATWPFLVTVTPFVMASYMVWDKNRTDEDNHYFRPIPKPKVSGENG